MTEQNIALKLCSDSMMTNFNQEFLEKLQLRSWNRELGTKDKLQHAKSSTFSAMFVDADISYSKENLLCWIRVLKNDGLLLMERIVEKTPEMLTALLPELLTFHKNSNPGIWIFSKNTLDVDELQSQIIQALSEKAPITRLFPLLEKMESADPHSVLPHFVRSKLFHKTPSVGQESWQRLFERTLTRVMNIYASLNTLANGNYQIGFQQREKTLGNAHLRRTPTPPLEQFYNKRWKGEHLAGKTIVVWTEFGLGDEIMFAQLAYYFKNQGANTVKWIVQSPIVSLLSTHPDIDQVIDSSKLGKQVEILGEFDYWVYPHEILAYVNTPFQHLPKRLPYLFAKSSTQRKTANLFPDTGNLKVGIAWRGDPINENDAARSIHNLDYIETLFKMDGIDWYCVQKVCNEQEIQLLEKYNIPQVAKNAKDFAQTAAMLMHLDCLVSTCTSVIHAAGAMGIPSLLMLSYIGDWRWGLADPTNLWYPTIRAFRCPAPLPVWDSVIEEVKQTLIERINWKQ
ncbi:hypothetical protein [Rodentibacter pneumotropicus]|uniref:hypothetical protein n=1 Tax=Rodentibacter pneumotropicus TaxID=758 RepID=UPI000987490C|nr:hypothetical protein [Rodentibacter pneumotropicus]OOF63421.1 hypothetical protein BKL50_03495 [Rodentibacter pneumotropicus]THA19362.1 methyltransferase type 11 [Rodentibacter pneumotropicus]